VKLGPSAHGSPTGDGDSLVGKTLDGRYRLTAQLAVGGMATVYRGQDLAQRCDVAVKVMRHDLVAAPDLVERFRREADIMRKLSHPNLVRVTDHGRSRDGHVYLIMELLSGESLFDRLRREGTLPPEELVTVLAQVCSALEAAHSHGVVHRDLKPENVFLARVSGVGEVAKVLDFGIAKFSVASDAAKTAAGVVVGTPEYLSPEQATGAAVDGRADLYAVGLIAWRGLVGHHPFHEVEHRGLVRAQADAPIPRLSEVVPSFHAWPALDAVVARACAKAPERRPRDAAELRRLLEDAVARPLEVPPQPPPGPPPAELVPGELLPPRASRAPPEPSLLLAGVGVAAVLAVVLAVSLFRRVPDPGEASRRLLAAAAPRAALEAADAALARHPEDPALLAVRGRALLSLPGRAGDGLESIARSAERTPLDPDARRELEASLGPDGALALLLDGSDCEARRGAVRRLAELRLQAARAALTRVSADAREHGGDPCGAPEALAALEALDAR
jgi:serine/threonine-protein kinase